MPDWCENMLVIRGSEASLAEFRERALGPRQKYKDYPFGVYPIMPRHEVSRYEELSFHAMMPVPNLLLSRTYNARFEAMEAAKVGTELSSVDDCISGHAWEVKFWGTKWGACESRVIKTIDPRRLVYAFLTPWWAPVVWVKQISLQYADLTFNFSWKTVEGRFDYYVRNGIDFQMNGSKLWAPYPIFSLNDRTRPKGDVDG